MGKVVMRHEVLGTLSYTDEDKAVSENVNVGGRMEKNAHPLGELAMEMDTVVSRSEEGLEQDALEKVAWTFQVELVEEGHEQEVLKKAAVARTLQELGEGSEQEALKQAVLRLQLEKVKDHLRALEHIALVISKSTYESDLFGVASTLHAMK